MSIEATAAPSVLTFNDAEGSPLSIRARALVFVDPLSQTLAHTVEQWAPEARPLLIHGEIGTGRELLARYIHRVSGRPGLFVSLNCASLSPQYGEAELFGHAPGIINSTASSRAGWLGSAQAGTLYLDEIADLSLSMQKTLLNVLETREVLRIGAKETTLVDVRIIASTTVDLSRVVAVGRFDKNLFEYLKDGFLHLPALRERKGDLLPTAEYLLGVHARRLGIATPEISEDAIHRLMNYKWLGNTKELEKIMHFALLLSDGVITSQHLMLSE
ncbi:MAG: sigma-54-dependent transcriptional regulator [Pseudomonas sp.]